MNNPIPKQTNNPPQKICMDNTTLLSLKNDLGVAILSSLIPYTLVEIHITLQKFMMLCLPFLSSGSNIFPPEEKCTPWQSAVQILGSIN